MKTSNRNIQRTGDYFFVKKTELKSDFTQVPNALFYVDLSATEKLILAYLLSNAESFRVTIYRIAKSVGSDHRTVKKALKKFREMKLIIPVTNRIIAININEILKLVADSEYKENKNGNSPNSRIPDTRTITNSNPIHSVVGQLPLDNRNTTTYVSGEIPDNNINQQEIKEEKQKEVSPSFSAIDVAKEVDDYLKSPSKFFYGHTQTLAAKLYERYRVEISEEIIDSIKVFQQVLYYHLLRMTNANNVQELNQILFTSGLAVSPNDILRAAHLLTTNKDIFADFKKENLGIDALPSKENKTD